MKHENNSPSTPVTNTEDKGYTPGELPKSLTLLVTGTGYRSNDDNKETLLLRSIDRTVHLHKEAHPHIVHNMVDRYNEYEKLKEAIEKFLIGYNQSGAHFTNDKGERMIQMEVKESTFEDIKSAIAKHNSK